MRASAPAVLATVRIPGDKSISHRCLILGSTARGESRFTNLNRGHDVAATAAALRACGVRCHIEDDGAALVEGGSLRSPARALDFGNSGTGARLMAGLLAGSSVSARLTGDPSLRTRPMDRIVDPLRRMGARVTALGSGRFLPLEIAPSVLHPSEHTLPVASAQVKSCLLLAALAGRVPVRLREPAPSRDHTERMLLAMGASLRGGSEGILLEPSGELRPLRMRVPGDFSSAAFFLGVAALVPGSRITIPGIGVNPGRTALLDVLAQMRADVRVVERGEEAGEPVADLVAAYAGPLRGVEVPAEMAPSLIDEVPLLAVLAARARGTTRLRGLAELRVKESDRLRAIAGGLRAVGLEATELDDGLQIDGSPRPLSGVVDTCLDHRIAMAFWVLGRSPNADIRLSETDSIATSFPEFPDLMQSIGS